MVLLDPSANSGNYEGGNSNYQQESKQTGRISEDDLLSDSDEDDIPF
jgi:hypothetical protein